MRYQDTWFSKQPMAMFGSFGYGRHLWLHTYVDVLTGNLQAMHNVNPDGSIDVLGAEIQRLSSGISFGSHNRESMQRSLLKHADKLKEAGATIVKQTKNTLIARYGRETAHYVITETGASTFFNNLRMAG